MQSCVLNSRSLQALQNLLHAVCSQGTAGSRRLVCPHKANGAGRISLKAQSCFLLHFVGVDLRGRGRYPKPCQTRNVWAIWISHSIPTGNNCPNLLNGDLPPLHLGCGQELALALVLVRTRLAQDQIRFNALRIATGVDPLLKQLLSILMPSAVPNKKKKYIYICPEPKKLQKP